MEENIGPKSFVKATGNDETFTHRRPLQEENNEIELYSSVIC